MKNRKMGLISNENILVSNMVKHVILLVAFVVVLLQTNCVNRSQASDKLDIKTEPEQVVQLLSNLDVWILPQPKSAAATGSVFDLTKCKGIRLVGTAARMTGLMQDFPNLLLERSGASLKVTSRKSAIGCITLGLFPDGTPSSDTPFITELELKDLGSQGYVLHIASDGIVAAATGDAGLYYASQTIAQIATDHTLLPGVYIRDWPSMVYRGVQYDISRGQTPTINTLKRLSKTISEGKANMMELYVEDMFKWKSHPDIAPPEAMTPAEARSLFDYAAQLHVEVHPMMQVLGHFDKIGSKPAYKHLIVPRPARRTEEDRTMTVDVRKPEAIALINDLLDEICEAFPGKFLNVDITEIDKYGFIQSGTKAGDLPDLMLGYTLKLRDIVAKHGMRLMVGQGPLDDTGWLNGIGPVLDKMPKDIVVASYYTAEFYESWDIDFSRLQQKELGLFTMSWIDSHAHIMPYVGHAMDFSDITVSRGLQYSAMGSITADWGDDGHYHMPGMTWFPFLYHCASAWTGAKLDRDYFNQAFSRLFFGVKNDNIPRAIILAGNINGQSIKLRNASGGVDEPEYVGNSRYKRYYVEFFGDPFSGREIMEIIDPGQKGLDILKPADEAVGLLEGARNSVIRNSDVVDELLFATKNYQAMAKKLIMRQHYLDPKVQRSQVAAELTDLIKRYESLLEEFKKLWLAGCKDAGSFQNYVRRYDMTINPCKKMAEEINAVSK